MTYTPWPNQVRAGEQFRRYRDDGSRSMCICSPTGSGKSRIMLDLTQDEVANRGRVVLYTNRKMLLEQTSRWMEAAGIPHGKRAAGYEQNQKLPVQISSIQTELSRTFRKQIWQLHRATLVLVDEAHLHATGTSEKAIKKHLEDGATVVGFTATPLNISHVYQDLVVAGTNSEMRRCGALLPAHVYSGTELDTSKVRNVKVGEDFSAGQLRTIWKPQIFASVYGEWRKRNPDSRPTIGFGPGVKESQWLAEQFHKKGVPAAHIDGTDVWLSGESYKSDREARDDVIAAWRDGQIKVVWNRFVLREGLDFPWIYNLILATPIGSLQSYVQTVGRAFRRDFTNPDMGHVIVTDHGGNWHRHGPPNQDWPWNKWWFMNPRVISDMRIDDLREKAEPEPITCPECSFVRREGRVCPACGFQHVRSSRMVLQANGKLRRKDGDVYKPRRRDYNEYEAEEKWRKMYHRMKRAGKTFRQAESLYAYENGWRWPPRSLPLMPTEPYDWYLPISDVPKSRLTTSRRRF